MAPCEDSGVVTPRALCPAPRSPSSRFAPLRITSWFCPHTRVGAGVGAGAAAQELLLQMFASEGAGSCHNALDCQSQKGAPATPSLTPVAAKSQADLTGEEGMRVGLGARNAPAGIQQVS